MAGIVTFTLFALAATRLSMPTRAIARYPATPPRDAVQQQPGYASQTSPGAVTLELLPAWDDGKLVVAIRATTHSGDLSEINLQRQVRLVIMQDTLPAVEATPLRGHHARATVAFRVAGRPRAFTIVIRDVRDQQLRILSWPMRAVRR